MTEKHVITLLANPAKQLLDGDIIAKAEQAILQAGGLVLEKNTLKEGIAEDISFTGIYPEDAQSAVRTALKAYPIDMIAQETDMRTKQLLISDMDSTMITVECIDEIADFVGKKAEVSIITDRAMNGELDFKDALRERVKLLAGLPEATLERVYTERVKFMPGAKELIATMKKNGAHCVLVSGGFTFFTSRVAKALGFDEHFGNELEVKDGKLTGNVIEPILDKDSKFQCLMDKTMEHGLSLHNTIAIGDGANDLPMLTAAGLGVAYHAKPIVRERARAELNHCDLSALVYAQGLNLEPKHARTTASGGFFTL